MGLILPTYAAVPKKTGQTTNYRVGDDGQYEAGLVRGFELPGDGTAVDLLTGLQWIREPQKIIPGSNGDILRAASPILTNQAQNAAGDWSHPNTYDGGDLVRDVADGNTFWVCTLGYSTAGAAPTPSADATHWIASPWTASAANLTTPADHTFPNCLAHSEVLDYAGFTDWRLPNAAELFSLLYFGNGAPPYIDQTTFPNTQAAYYMASTTPEDQAATSVIRVNFNISATVVGSFGYGATEHFLRPVRGGV